MSNLNIREVESGFIVTEKGSGHEYAFETARALASWVGNYLTDRQVEQQAKELQKQAVEES